MKKAKVVFYLIMTAAILFATTQPPQKGNAQPYLFKYPATPHLQPVPDTIQQLIDRLDRKEAEVKSIVLKSKPKVIYRYVSKTPEQITVYTRINGEVTEHKVRNDNGFYVLDLKPETETVTETYYIDTCIHEKKKSLWKQLLGR